jgi:UbiD family decarboxylase
MRAFLDLLRQRDDLVRIERAVSPRFEVAAGIRKTSQVGGPALWFEDVEGHDMPVIGGLYATRRRLLWGWGVEDTDGFFERFAAGQERPTPAVEVPEGPCQQVCWFDDDAVFERLPVCTYNEKDGGPFVTMGIQFATHPAYGPNASISRMQIFDSKHAGVLSVPPQHLGVYFAEAEAEDQPLEVAVAIGNDPFVTAASQISGSIYLDELTIAGGWLGEPVEVVRCKTIDVLVPATSEIVLEGHMLPGVRRMEGPFGEYPGYYSPAGERPIFRLSAITHRRDPVFLAGLTGEPTTDNHVIKTAVQEAMLHRRLKDICPTIRDVCFTDASAGAHVAISLRPTFGSQSRDVMLASMSAERLRPKLVTVVDDDIDVRDPRQVEWATAFRMQADRDVVVLPRMRGVALDPSSPEPGSGAVMGIDATRPFGRPFWETTRVPGVDEFEIPGIDA